jgi:hypothetical protein
MSEEYKKGFEDGKEATKREIASNPAMLFDLAPMIAHAISEKVNESGLTEAQKKVVQRALNGEISQSSLFEALKNPMKWQQE